MNPGLAALKALAAATGAEDVLLWLVAPVHLNPLEQTLEETRDTLRSGLCLHKHFPPTIILREYIHSQDHRCENTADAAACPSPRACLSVHIIIYRPVFF